MEARRPSKLSGPKKKTGLGSGSYFSNTGKPNARKRGLGVSRKKVTVEASTRRREGRIHEHSKGDEKGEESERGPRGGLRCA